MARPGLRRQAQAEATSGLIDLYRRKQRLLINRENLIAERAEMVRQHNKATCSIERRMLAVTTELLKIGG